MELLGIIRQVLKVQTKRNRKVAVDIVISNGNILLRSFRILELDIKNGKIKGLTRQEEYIAIREQRESIYCTLKLDEIKELSVLELGLEYINKVFAPKLY